MASILLIDDEVDVRAALRGTLLSLGHQVEEAENGRDGIARFQRTPPDLVITDIVMPEMEGLETILRLKEISPTIKIIAMAEDGRVAAGEHLRFAKKFGASQTLAKPFSQCELEAAVDQALRASEAKPHPKLTFLVVDDEVNSRLLNRDALEGEFPDCQVIECSSVAEAIAESSGKPVDAVVTDHHLGQSEGRDLIVHLRGRGIGCPVIMVTGNSDPSVHERAYQAGATRVFFGNDLDFAPYLREALAKK